MISISLIVGFTMSVLLLSAQSWIVRPLMPQKYTLEIKTDLEKGTFSGQVIIYTKCELPAVTITLNALKSKLKIDEAKVVVADDKDPHTNLVETASWGPVDEYFLIDTKQMLPYGSFITITIPFEGVLGEEAQDGYFIIKDGNDRYIAASQFTKLKARSGFPCFDEPFMKAEFTVILHRKEGERTFSSMTLESTNQKKDDEGWVTDVYKPSVKLSPHLIAYVVTNIPLQSTPACEQRITYWYKDERDSEIAGKFACRKTSEQSTLFSVFYDLPPLETSVAKIDVLLHPQFPYNFIGSWGLILSRESPAMKKVWDISDSYLTNARLAYQYFGGIVSYDSGRSSLTFKSLILYLANQMGGRSDHSYVVENLLFVDGRLLTNQFVGEFDPDRYKFGLDTFTGYKQWDYNFFLLYVEKKDILLLRMIHYTLGNTVFKKTLRQFFDTFKYRYASTEDFWKTFDTESKPITDKLATAITYPEEKSTKWWQDSTFVPVFVKDVISQTFSVNAPMSNLPFGISVGNVMDTWIVFGNHKEIQFDYPVIKVTRLNYQSINVKQERFQGNWVVHKEEGKVSKMWWIPLTYTTSWNPNFVQTTPSGWIGPLHGEDGVKLFALTTDSQWIIFNIQHIGLYRVQYEEKNWNLIINDFNKQDKFGKIHYLNRVQLVRDALDFGFLGELHYNYVFRLVNYLRFENNPIVWRVFFIHIKNLESAIRRTNHYERYQANMKKLLSTLFEKTFPDLTWTSIYNVPLGNDLERTAAEFKLIVLKESFSVGVDAMITMCQEAFNKWKSEGSIPEYKNWVQRDFTTLAISASLSAGNEGHFEFVFTKLTESNNEDKNSKVYIDAIQYTNNEASVHRVLEWVFSQESSRIPMKKSELIKTFAAQPKTFTPTLNYIYNNLEKVKTYTDDDDFQAIIRSFALEMNESELAQLEKFLDDNPELKSGGYMKLILTHGGTGNERRQAWLDANVNSLEGGFTAWER